MKIIGWLLAAACALNLAGAAAQTKNEYRLSVVTNRPVPIAEGGFRWAELAQARSGGRLNVKVYPGSSLVGGDQTRELTALRQGIVDLLVASTINLSPSIRAMNLFSLPFLLPDARAFDAVVAGKPGEALFGEIESHGAVPLAWGDNGFRELSNARRPIRAPEDLRGLKIRYAASPIFAEILTALGANPTQMSFADLQPALSAGLVDGQENSVNLFLASKMDQLAQRHITLWHYVSDAAIFMVARRVWDALPESDRDALRTSARDAAAEMTALSRRGLGEGGDVSALRELAARGVQVVEPGTEERARFRDATRDVYERWAPQIGAGLVRDAEAAIAASR